MIETFIKGREFSVGVVKYNRQIVVLPITEIMTSNDFFDYQAKYEGKSEEITPAKLENKLKNKLEKTAKKIYKTLKIKGLSRSEFILKNNEFYFLEINTVPGLSKEVFYLNNQYKQVFQLISYFRVLFMRQWQILIKRKKKHFFPDHLTQSLLAIMKLLKNP